MNMEEIIETLIDAVMSPVENTQLCQEICCGNFPKEIWPKSGLKWRNKSTTKKPVLNHLIFKKKKKLTGNMFMTILGTCKAIVIFFTC